MIKKFQEYFKESTSFPTSEDQIVQLCERYKIKNYSINPDLSIDVEGSVSLNNLKLSSLPLRFSRVGGSFYCSYNQLTTLEGSPREVGGGFYCYNNHLTTLEGGPREVEGYFDCRYNLLTTLEGSPREVKYFYCSHNPVSEIVYKFPDHEKAMRVWDDFNVVRNGNELSAYRFKEMYLDLTGEEFEGDLVFRGYKVVE